MKSFKLSFLLLEVDNQMLTSLLALLTPFFRRHTITCMTSTVDSILWVSLPHWFGWIANVVLLTDLAYFSSSTVCWNFQYTFCNCKFANFFCLVCHFKKNSNPNYDCLPQAYGIYISSSNAKGTGAITLLKWTYVLRSLLGVHIKQVMSYRGMLPR